MIKGEVNSKVKIVLVLLLIQLQAFSQVTFWTEDFDGNSGAGTNWGVLNQSIGVQGITPNQWYISCAENGNAIGACGTGCGVDQTLHLSSTTVGDIGAAYDASAVCLPGCFLCDFFPAFCSDVTSDVRSESSNISTVGFVGLVLSFNYMENGQGATDNCILEYSIDGGVNWLTLIDLAKTPLCGGGQGMWTSFSVNLPVACENIANLKLGFHWLNNADGVGTDPSFAVNDIEITRASMLPVSLIEFEAKKISNNVLLSWITLSESNNDYFSIQKSQDLSNWIELGKIDAMGNSVIKNQYSFIDRNLFSNNQINYYRLKQVDFNGEYLYSQIISYNKGDNQMLKIYPNPATSVLNIQLAKKESITSKIEIFNNISKNVYTNELESNMVNQIDISTFESGFYIVKITTNADEVYLKKLVIAH